MAYSPSMNTQNTEFLLGGKCRKWTWPKNIKWNLLQNLAAYIDCSNCYPGRARTHLCCGCGKSEGTLLLHKFYFQIWVILHMFFLQLPKQRY